MTTEEIKRALQCCIGLNGGCDDCPCRHTYYEEDNCRYIIIDAHNAIVNLEKRCNALEALEQRCKALEKRSEPVTPVREVGSYSQIFRCRNCDTLMVFQKQKYCHECGQAVKW